MVDGKTNVTCAQLREEIEKEAVGSRQTLFAACRSGAMQMQRDSELCEFETSAVATSSSFAPGWVSQAAAALNLAGLRSRHRIEFNIYGRCIQCDSTVCIMYVYG